MTSHTHIQSPTEARTALEATSRAAEAAHEAHLQDAVSSVTWERRGFLQVLKRVDRPSSGAELD